DASEIRDHQGAQAAVDTALIRYKLKGELIGTALPDWEMTVLSDVGVLKDEPFQVATEKEPCPRSSFRSDSATGCSRSGVSRSATACCCCTAHPPRNSRAGSTSLSAPSER